MKYTYIFFCMSLFLTMNGHSKENNICASLNVNHIFILEDSSENVSGDSLKIKADTATIISDTIPNSSDTVINSSAVLDSGKRVEYILPEIRIGKILIVGNEVTQDDIITREISLRENTILDLKMLEHDVRNLNKLGLFNKIDVLPIPTDSANKVDLMFMLEEKFYILPIPQGGFRDGQFSKFWAGLNLRWFNFRGRNETLNFNFGIGYEPFVGLSYSVPWIGEDARYFSSVSLRYSKNYNRSLLALNETGSSSIPDPDSNFVNYNFSASYKFGKYFNRNFSVSSTLKYNLIESVPYQPGRTVSTDGTDSYFTFGMFSKFDTRDSYEYTLAGSYYSLEYEKIGFGKTMDFNRVNLEMKKFIPIEMDAGKFITFANRTFSTIAFGGSVPTYMREFFGYNDLIRGYKRNVLEGENKLGVFNEFRIPVINPFYIHGKELPVVRSVSALKNLNYKFGLFATIFYDIGGVWNKNSNFFKTKFYSGYGVGLNFILPFGFIGRTDFSMRQQDNTLYPSVIFDLDAAF